MKFFSSFENVQELKNQYRKLVFKLHPDHGGSKEQFQQMQNEYEKLLRDALNNFFSGQYESSEKQSSRVDWEMQCDEVMREKLNEIIHLANILNIEIIGNWIWVTGTTKPYKEELKEKGFKFSGKKVAWYWHDGKYKKKSKRQFSLDELRNTFHNAKVEQTEEEKERENAELPSSK